MSTQFYLWYKCMEYGSNNFDNNGGFDNRRKHIYIFLYNYRKFL